MDERERGLMVLCAPTEDPEVTEMQHRVVCLTRPYANCQSCKNRNFSILFNGNPQARKEIVLCPRWVSESDRLRREAPDSYAECEVATCQSKPFLFCPSCPSREVLLKMDVDKKKSGWYSRWKRFSTEDEDE